MLKSSLSASAALALLAAVALTSAANAQQVFPKDKLVTWDRENAAGGTGTLAGKFSFTRREATKDQAIKEIGWMTLKPGDSVGMHKHETNEDAYVIISGEGVFSDTAGNETKVKAGDITIARKGDSHALKNTGTEPLVFLDVIAEQ